jgi:hypothetical protein
MVVLLKVAFEVHALVQHADDVDVIDGYSKYQHVRSDSIFQIAGAYIIDFGAAYL